MNLTKLDPAKKLFVVGDIHSSYDRVKLPLTPSNLIFLGDLGNNLDWYKRLVQKGHDIYLIRGNHDDKSYFSDPIRKHMLDSTGLYFLKEVELLEYKGKTILCIGGAISIDRQTSLELYDTHVVKDALDEVAKILSTSRLLKVDLMVSHTCPIHGCDNKRSDLLEACCQNDSNLRHDIQKEMHLLQMCMLMSKTENSIFGHFHKSYKQEDKKGKSYQCLDIAEMIEVTF